MLKKIIVFCLVLLYLSCEKNENPLIGQSAFKFELLDINNNKVKLTDFNNKKILLHFWADWCSSCREEFFTLQNVYESLKTQNAILIGINVGQSKEHVKELIDEYGVTFPMLRDENKKIAELYKIHGLPMNIFITTKRKIYKIVPGWIDKEKINNLMKQIN